MTDKITDKSTKATILEAYKEAQKEIRRLKREPARAASAVKVEPYEPKTATEISSGIASLKNNYAYALSELEDQTIAKMDQLTRIEGEIKSRESALEECHDIIREADTLAALKYANEQERENQQVTLTATKKRFDETMAETRKKWERESEEFIYETEKRRQRIKEEIDETEEQAATEIAEKQASFERSIQDRLAELDRREAVCEKIEGELEDIGERHADEISREVQTAIANTTSSLKYQYEADNKLLQQKVESLGEVITELRTENKELKEELKSINKMANEVAQQAVQSNKVVHISEKQA